MILSEEINVTYIIRHVEGDTYTVTLTLYLQDKKEVWVEIFVHRLNHT